MKKRSFFSVLVICFLLSGMAFISCDDNNNDGSFSLVGTWVCTQLADLRSFTLNSNFTCTLDWWDHIESGTYSVTYSVSGNFINIITPARPNQLTDGRITANTITFFGSSTYVKQ